MPSKSSLSLTEIIGLLFIVVGLILLVGPSMLPMSIMRFGPAEVSGISERSATSMFAGIVLILIGIALALKKRLF